MTTIRGWKICAAGRKWGEINRLAAELTSLQDYLDKMATTRNVLFPKVERNITIAQGKQKGSTKRGKES